MDLMKNVISESSKVYKKFKSKKSSFIVGNVIYFVARL